MLGDLHDIHPLVALAAINFVLAGSLVLLVAGLVGFRGYHVRSKRRSVPLSVRIRRLFR